MTDVPSPPDSPDSPGRSFLRDLRGPEPLVTVELRPPGSDLSGGDSMDAWIDLNHAVRRLGRAGRYVFLTDNAVGAREEENLAHLAANLPEDTDPERIVPILTAKHTLEYCLTWVQRAWAQGFRALTVLGGDRDIGPPRCVDHGWQLRAMIRERIPDLALGGWANPHRDAAEQVGYLLDERAHADFFLTQVVSHHTVDRAEALLDEASRRGLEAPAVFGVFHYRSANPSTLEALDRFFPVPAERITREFEAGDAPETITARTIRALRDVGARHVYVSNLRHGGAGRTLAGMLERV